MPANNPNASCIATEIPFKLLTQIFKMVQDDPGERFTKQQMMENCSLVCSAWRYAAQRELFCYFTVDVGRPAPPFFNIVTTRRRHSHIPKYIEHLVLRFDWVTSALVSFDPHLAPFLQKIQYLQRLTFENGNFDTVLNHQLILDQQGVRQALIHVLYLPYLTKFEVRNCCKLPLALISCCPHLSWLSLEWTHGTRGGSMDLNSSPNTVNLLKNPWDDFTVTFERLSINGLTIEDVFHVATFLSRSFQCKVSNRFKILDLDLTHCFQPSVGYIFRFCDAVEELTLSFKRVILDPFPECIAFDADNIRCLRRLRIVKIKGAILGLQYPHFQEFVEEWFLHFIKTLPNPNVLKSISFSMAPLRECDCCTLPAATMTASTHEAWLQLKNLVWRKFPRLLDYSFNAPWMTPEVASRYSFTRDPESLESLSDSD